MKDDPRKWPLARWAGYLLYGFLATVVFLYILFPFNRLERFAMARVAEGTALQLDLQERRLGFPLNVEWRKMRVANLNGPRKPGVEGEQVSLRFALLPLLDRRISADYRFKIFGGEMSGVAEWQGTKPFAYFVRGSARDLTLNSVQDGAVTRLRGEWEYRWDPSDLIKGQGQATVEVTGVLFKAPLAGMPPIALRRLTGRVILNNGMATIEDVRGEGDNGAVRGGGTVMLRDDVRESLVNITLEFRSREDGALSHLIIKGPLRFPAIFVNGVPLSSPETSL